VFAIERSRLGDGHTRIELRGRYAAFHYWFFQ